MFQEWLFSMCLLLFILRGKDKKSDGIMPLSSKVLNQDTLHTAVQVGSSILHSAHQYYFLLMIPHRYPVILEELPHLLASCPCTDCGLCNNTLH